MVETISNCRISCVIRTPGSYPISAAVLRIAPPTPGSTMLPDSARDRAYQLAKAAGLRRIGHRIERVRNVESGILAMNERHVLPRIVVIVGAREKLPLPPGEPQFSQFLDQIDSQREGGESITPSRCTRIAW
jgi:hypothetical protein